MLYEVITATSPTPIRKTSFNPHGVCVVLTGEAEFRFATSAAGPRALGALLTSYNFV